jgi:hypothetical protein
VTIDNCAHDAHAETEAATVRRARWIKAGEALECNRALLGGNAWTRIIDGERGLAVTLA